MTILQLPARTPFNFLAVVNSHGWRQLAPYTFDESSNTLAYVLRLSNARVLELKLRAENEGVSITTDKLTKAEQKEVTNKVSWMFGLDQIGRAHV